MIYFNNDNANKMKNYVHHGENSTILTEHFFCGFLVNNFNKLYAF